MDSVIDVAMELQRVLNNARIISDYDRSVYVERYGEDRVSFIEYQSEILAEPGHNIQACLNIAYDKGFVDCIEMIGRCLSRIEVTE
ncbi:MAG: hypothetical protein E7547_02495 [Ruminococcaceae bacterium]|nr:hypothetical protein [Oscillospiraceae bacterium]